MLLGRCNKRLLRLSTALGLLLFFGDEGREWKGVCGEVWIEGCSSNPSDTGAGRGRSEVRGGKGQEKERGRGLDITRKRGRRGEARQV